MIQSNQQKSPLHIHTLKTLCQELVSGRSITVEGEEGEFQLRSDDAKSIFYWYTQNTQKWAGNVMVRDLNAIVDYLDKKPPTYSPVVSIASSENRRIAHLKSMKVHRFAGIHPHGLIEEPPEDFYFEFNRPLTILEGMNGAGKTSLLNAITWCLTGQVYRSQRPPESAEQRVALRFQDGASDAEEDDQPPFDMSPVTPVPTQGVLKTLQDGNLPLDTWVELTFVDNDDNELFKVKRSIGRSPRGRIRVTAPDTTTLGFDPIAFEVGTRIPGLIPYIQLDQTSDFGRAVASLTGIKPLQDLASHAKRAKSKLEKDVPNSLNSEIKTLDEEFGETRQEMVSLFKEYPELGTERSLPLSGPDKNLEARLTSLRSNYEILQARALEKAQTILGESFDPNNHESRNDLIENIGPAIGQLDVLNLKRLPSALRLAKISSIGEETFEQIEHLIHEIRTQADEIDELAQKPEIAARLRLYARVAGWLKEQEKCPSKIRVCPVCEVVIEGKKDPVTGKFISEQIQQYLERDCGFLEKTIADWENSTIQRLRSEIPPDLRLELDHDLPDSPIDLISKAFGEELFDSQIFKGCLAPLRNIIKNLCLKELKALPQHQEPDEIILPERLGSSEGVIGKSIWRLRRAISFGRWRAKNREAAKAAFERIIISDQTIVETTGLQLPVSEWSLMSLTNELDRIVKQANPIKISISNLNLMQNKLAARRKKENQINLCGRAAAAMQEIISLEDLVELQVEFLIRTLHTKATEFKRSLYRPACIGAPEIASTDVGSDGRLTIETESDGTRVSARHVCNSSDLRATLLSMVVAFWQYLLETRGGLSLLLLDDVQELFDPENRKRIAHTIPDIMAMHARLILTTNDTSFRRSVLAACSSSQVDHRKIHPLNAKRQHIELGQFTEVLDEKRRVFENYPNEHQSARDYIKQLRIYLENRLLDFGDAFDSALPKKPTLSDLIDALRRAIRVHHQAFDSRAFSSLVNHASLRQGSDFLRVMNESHHSGEDTITYGEVYDLRDDCVQVRDLVEVAYRDYELFLRRDVRVPNSVSQLPPFPPLMQAPIFELPIFADLAAASDAVPAGEIVDTDDTLCGARFGNHAIYLVNSHNFGFACPITSRVLVDLSLEDVEDNSLVIALHKEKVLARRLIMDSQNPHFIILISEAEISTQRPPALRLPLDEVRALKVVGILFDDTPVYMKKREEAILVNGCTALSKVEVAYKIRGDSAVPLAYPGQIVLCGRKILPSELHTMEGQRVAICTSGGEAFKRIGQAIPGLPYIRQFEAIGSGSSLIVCTEDVEENPAQLAVMTSARPVLGVLY